MSKKGIKYNKPIIGLLGAVGAGKSVVADEFALLGCAVIDADKINHQLLVRPDVEQQLINWWGQEIMEAGHLSRSKVAELVFADKVELERLTNLLYPLIFQEVRTKIDGFLAADDYPAVVLDAPILLEAGQREICDFLVFISVSDEKRRKRLQKSRKWDEKRIKNVENCQISLDIKAQISDYIVNNSSGLPNLARQVASVFSQIMSSTA